MQNGVLLCTSSGSAVTHVTRAKSMNQKDDIGARFTSPTQARKTTQDLSCSTQSSGSGITQGAWSRTIHQCDGITLPSQSQEKGRPHVSAQTHPHSRNPPHDGPQSRFSCPSQHFP
ncbi:hypothetical protein ACET3Z_008906 [Daucus carota]